MTSAGSGPGTRPPFHPRLAAVRRIPILANVLSRPDPTRRSSRRIFGESHGELVRLLVGRLALLELMPPVLARALEPFPTPVRTLDALHLASVEFLRGQGQAVQLATYDQRMREASRALSIPLYDP